jgi:tRNA (cmo5U34)-methyltransferase
MARCAKTTTLRAMSDWHSPKTATEWDASADTRLPTRPEQQAILLALLEEAELGEDAVLDLGVGSGLVAEAVLERLPSAALVGIDFSDAMLERAQKRLDPFGSRAQLLRHDLANLAALALPVKRYAAVISVQTLHHLSDAEKEAAIAWAARAIEPGGLIIIVDRVSVPETLFDAWATTWRRVDPDTPATYAEYGEELERAGDRPARLQDQLTWLEHHGMDAACLHAYGNRALLVGRKRNGT